MPDWEGAPERFHVVKLNPPFGGKGRQEAQSGFAFKTRATQALFMQHVMQILEPGGRCGIIVLDEAAHRTNEGGILRSRPAQAARRMRRWSIVSLPGGVPSPARAPGVKTNLCFHQCWAARPSCIWYRDLSHIKVGRRRR